MKKILTLSLLVIPIFTQAQIASRLLPSQSIPQPINAPNIVWVDTVAGGQQRIWVADRDSLKLYTYQIKGLKDSIAYWGDQRYPMLTEVYYNPSFVGSIAANKLTGLNEFMIRSALGYKPADSANIITINSISKSIGSNPVFTITQQNSDWNSNSGITQILNKPTLGTAASANSSDFATAAQGALATSALQPSGDGSLLTGLTKLQVGLSNVDNTSDANKNVLSATKLTTARTINGVSFDGTSNITIPGPSWTVNNNVSRSIVTVAAAANGWQISSTRNSDVRYSVTISTSVSLAGNSSGYVVLEVSSTNSTTASDWVEVARSSSGQSGTLVIGLSLNQIVGGEVSASILPGYYCRLRSVNVAGTPIYSLNSNQEILK